MDVVNSSLILGTTLGAVGGIFATYFRESRKSKRDANEFAIQYMDRQEHKLASQDKRIDELNRTVGELIGRLDQVSETNRILQAEKAALLLENTELKAEVKALKDRKVRHTDPH